MRNRLILFAAACLLPLLVVTLIILSATADAGREQVLDAQAATAEVVASVLAATITDNQKVLQELASIDRVRRVETGTGHRGASISSAGPIRISTGSSCSIPRPIWSPAPASTRHSFGCKPPFTEAVDRSLKLGEPASPPR